MRMPQKTILGISAFMLTVSGLKELMTAFNGQMTDSMHSALTHAGSSPGYATGFVVGYLATVVLRLLLALGLWIMLAQRFRKKDPVA